MLMNGIAFLGVRPFTKEHVQKLKELDDYRMQTDT